MSRATPGTDLGRFRAKTAAFLHEHEDHVALQRLRRNRQLTTEDLSALEQMLMASGIGQYFEWVKLRSALIRGVTFGTMLQDEAQNFIRLGGFIERADNTARILDVKYHVLHHNGDEGATDFYQWGALLRSLSAFEVYRKVYRDLITPARVAELLMLRLDMPRSLHACTRGIVRVLEAIKNDQSAETERLAGILHAHIHYARIEDILKHGLHEYLTDFMDRIYDLGEGISKDFLMLTQTEAAAALP